MRWCKFCGKRLEFMKEDNKWIPLDETGTDHRKLCVPNKKYMVKSQLLINGRYEDDRVIIH